MADTNRTVNTTLRMFDRFSSNMARAVQVMDTATAAAGRLRQSLQSKITLDIDMGAAMTHIEQIKSKMGGLGAHAINIVINADDVLAKMKQIRNRFANDAVKITLDPGESVAQATAIRKKIDQQLTAIKARIELDLPQDLMAMFQSLRMLVMRLIVAIRQMRRAAGGGNQSPDRQPAIQQNNRILGQMRQMAEGQEGVNNRIRDGTRSAGGMLGQIKAMAAAYLSLRAAKGLFEASVGGAMQQQQVIDTLSARAGSTGLGNAIYKQVADQALKYGQSVGDAMGGTMSFMSNTMDPKRLADLNMLAMRLSKLNPEEGLKGASFSLKELMSGDYTSIAERFNMSRSVLKDSDARKAGVAGDVDGFIKGMDELLNKQNLTQAAFEKMLESPAAQWQKAINTFKFNLANTGQAGLQAFLPLITMLNDGFAAGKFDWFFDGIAVGFKVIGDAAAAAGRFIFEHMDLVRYTLIAIGIVLAVLAIQWIVTWIAAAWPVIAVIAAIVGVLVILNKMGVTAGEVVGYVTGVFYGLFAFLWNQIALIYNPLISLAEFIGNLFIDPVYAIKKLFYDMLKNVTDYFSNMINSLISGLNWLITKINSISGTSISLITEMGSEWLDELKPTTDKNVFDFSKYKMEMKDLSKEFTKGYDKGSGFVSNLTDAIGNLQPFGSQSGPGKIDVTNVGTVGEVGKIKDKVDISSEDLRVMRDLAEMKSIQNFVTLTPTVQVTTGDIRSEVDVNEMIRRIEQAMEREIANSAEGVYGG